MAIWENILISKAESTFPLRSFLRLTVALPIFNMFCFVISRPESHQIFQIHSFHQRGIKQESDYLAIRSGSEPLCDICIRGGSHFHARRVLAVPPTPSRRGTLRGPPGARMKQNNYLFSPLYIYIFIYLFTSLFVYWNLWDVLPKGRKKKTPTYKQMT